MLFAREAGEGRDLPRHDRRKARTLCTSWHSGGRNRRHFKPPSTDSSASRCQHLSHPTNRFPLQRQSFSHHAILRTPNSMSWPPDEGDWRRSRAEFLDGPNELRMLSYRNALL